MKLQIQNNQSIDTPYKEKLLKTKIVNSIEELQQFKTDWDKLVDISNATIYQKSYWLFNWWKHYHNPDADRMLILFFYDDEILVGIAPLYIHEEKFFGKTIFKRLLFIGSETLHGQTFGLFNDNSPSDYLEIICYPKYETRIFESFVNFLINNKDLYDETILTNLNDNNSSFKYLHEILKNCNLRFTFRKGEICPYIKTPSSFEDFLNSRTTSVKRRFTQSWKESGKLFKIKKSGSFEELQIALRQIKELHQNKWNKTGYPGFFGDLRYERFFHEFINSCYNDDVIWCGVAYNNDKVIAGRLAFKYKGRLYDYLSGIDDTAFEAKRRPGLVLLMHMIKDSIDENIPVVDLLRGDEAYKKDFTNSFTTNWNLRIYKGNVNVRYIFVIFLLILKFIKILIIRETMLLKIWMKVYKMPLSIYKYSRNRFQSLVRKFKNFLKAKNQLQ